MATGHTSQADPAIVDAALPLGRLVYLYAVVETQSRARQALAAREIAGLDPDAPLFAVEAGGLTAAVSYVPTALFGEEPLNALAGDLPRLTPFAVRHEAAVAALLPYAPALVPMAFGAVYAHPERVRRLLEEQAAQFHALLDRVRGRQEWGVKVFRDRDQTLRATETASAEMLRLTAAAATASPGRAFLLNKQRQRVRAAEADRMAEAACDDLLARLSAASTAVRRDALAAADVDGMQLVLKAAFLVNSAASGHFRTLVATLSERVAPWGFRLDLSGPWAPYSFVGAAGGA